MCSTVTIWQPEFPASSSRSLLPHLNTRSDSVISLVSRDDNAFAGQTSLHHACKVAETSKLSKLLRALKAVGADLRAMDTVDGRGFTPFHIACAGGHAQVRVTGAVIPPTVVDACLWNADSCGLFSQVVEALCHAGCDPSLRNADGYTGWQLAESLDRAEVLALNREELIATAQGARARRHREVAGQKSPVVTLKTSGSGLLQHESY
jgi:ankyrin repeat protein